MDENKNQTENKKSQALLFLEHLQTELQTIQSISEPALKLRMFALANDLISAKNYFRKLKEGLDIQLMHDIDRDVDYKEWYNPEKWRINFDKILWAKAKDNYWYEPNRDELNAVSELINRKELKDLDELQDILNKTNSKKKIEDCREKIAHINENTLNVNRAMSDWTVKMLSDVYFSFDIMKNAIQQGIFDLVNELFAINKKLSANKWSDELLENMYDNLEKRSVSYGIFGNGKSEYEEYFNKWKEDEDELDEGKYNILIYNELKKLLSTKFCIIIEGHENRKKANELSKNLGREYVDYGDEEIEVFEMKYFFLMKIIKYEGTRYVFANKKKIAKHIFTNRKALSENDIKSFFRFKIMCELVYADLDAMKPKEKKETGKTGRKPGSIFTDDSEKNRKKIASEFNAFLNKHNNTGNKGFNSASDNYINIALYAFVEYWGRGYTQTCLANLIDFIQGKKTENICYYSRTIYPTQENCTRYNFTGNNWSQIFIETIFANIPYKTISKYENVGDVIKPVLEENNECDLLIFEAMEKYLLKFVDDFIQTLSEQKSSNK